MKKNYRYAYYECREKGTKVIKTSGVFRFNEKDKDSQFKYIIDIDQSQYQKNNNWFKSWPVIEVIDKLVNWKERNYTFKEISEKEAFLLLI